MICSKSNTQPSNFQLIDDDLAFRLDRVLAAAARAGRLSWQEVDHLLTILERAEIAANNTAWSIYQSLGELTSNEVVLAA